MNNLIPFKPLAAQAAAGTSSGSGSNVSSAMFGRVD